jgi:hypothetical protein
LYISTITTSIGVLAAVTMDVHYETLQEVEKALAEEKRANELSEMK